EKLASELEDCIEQALADYGATEKAEPAAVR
ncbi:MAG: hypothetical protein QOG52_379, partial [Frankiaceae bacterium]|nr:hypothetical protein [Frankiaceae bacterium]